MLIDYISDIHLDAHRTPVRFQNTSGAKVLVLGGDITEYDTAPRKSKEFFDALSEQYDDIVYIMGNHEHWAFGWDAPTKTKELVPENFHVLDCSTVKIGDVVFYGGTMWTDFDKGNPMAMYREELSSNVKYIQAKGYECRASSFYYRHVGYINNLKKTLETIGDQKLFVVSHHGPSTRSIDPYYVNSLTNFSYVSSLDDLIMDSPEILVWQHGHVHSRFDYQIGSTRVICNPYGYSDEVPDHGMMTIEV